MTLSGFHFYRLALNSDIKPSSCSDEDLNGFLLDDAKNYLKERLAVTYIIEDPRTDKTVAYFSLLNDSIAFDAKRIGKSVWNRLNRNIPNRKRRGHYPALKIGRLAVATEYSRLGIGKDIIYLIKYMAAGNKSYGCRFITLDAYKDVVAFYEKCDFKLFSSKDEGDATRAMYFDLKNFED